MANTLRGRRRRSAPADRGGRLGDGLARRVAGHPTAIGKRAMIGRCRYSAVASNSSCGVRTIRRRALVAEPLDGCRRLFSGSVTHDDDERRRAPAGACGTAGRRPARRRCRPHRRPRSRSRRDGRRSGSGRRDRAGSDDRAAGPPRRVATSWRRWSSSSTTSTTWLVAPPLTYWSTMARTVPSRGRRDDAAPVAHDGSVTVFVEHEHGKVAQAARA